MTRTTIGRLLLTNFLGFSLNNGIPKPPDRTGNKYNSLSFSEIVSPVIAGSKIFGIFHQLVLLDGSFLV